MFFFASRRRHTSCALVTGVQTCALPIWVAAVLAADAELDVRPRRAAALGADHHQLADALCVERDEGVLLDQATLLVGTEEISGIVARQAEAGLGQVVGAEGEELGALGDLGGPQEGTRQLDHGVDAVVDLDALALAPRRRDGVAEPATNLER